MLEVKIFRFNAKNDVLAYYKPYFFDKFSFNTLTDLLAHVRKVDPYFDFEGADFVRINGVVVAISTEFAQILSKFGDSFEIEPLSTRRASKDLLIDDGDFWAKFEPFARFCTSEDRKFYATLKPYFYSGFINEMEPGFVGVSAVIFAKFLAEKYPEKKAEILALVSDAKFGVWIAPTLAGWLFENSDLSAQAADEAVAWVKSNLSALAVKMPNLADEPAVAKLNLKHDLTGFKIAFYGEMPADFSTLKAKNISLESANLPCGFELLGLNDELAIKMASKILFEAFDSGADFLCVANEQAFYMFDTLSRECAKAAGRELGDFYVLHAAELAAIANGQTPASLKVHKLKVQIC